MAGLTDLQVNELRHTDFPFDDKKRQYCLSMLWRLTSDQAYIQRTTLFDNSIFCKASELYLSVVDYYLMAYLFKKLKLDVIRQYTDNTTDLEADIGALYGTEKNVVLLYNHKRDESFLYAFDDKVRNSVAHGTMNFDRTGTATFFGQVSKKQSSSVNLFISLRKVDLMLDWLESRNELLSYDLEGFQRETYRMYFGELSERDNGYYELQDGTIVIFDNSFSFKSKDAGGDQESQIAERIQTEYQRRSISADAKVDYLIRGASPSLFKKVAATFPNTTIIAENRLLEHFGL